MHSPESILGFRSRAASTGENPRLWGHDPVELHDHFWRQVGVEIVRPGTRTAATGVGSEAAGRPPSPRRPRAYVLLGLDELTAFAPGPALRRLAGSRRRSLLIELVDPAAPGYVERIAADERDALVSIERRYDPTPPIGSVLLTRDRRLAEWWRRTIHPARHPRAATAVDRALARRRRAPMHGTAVGVLQDGRESRSCVQWFETMMRLDDALAGTVPGVSPREPGVWVHQSARIGPHVSLAGPLWIGEHVVLEGNASLVGPRMLLDDAPRISASLGQRSGSGGLGRGRMGGAFPGLEGDDGGRVHGAANDAGGVNAATAATPAAAASMLGALRDRILGGRRRSATDAGSRRGGAAAFIETRRITPAAVRLAPPGIQVRPEPRSVRVFNVLVSAAALLAVLPLFPVIMLAIRLEDGRPFFFGHVRQTRGGRNFTCWKFRTMCRDAERMKSQLERENVCDGPQFHIADDPRLLRVGRLLRRFHLDELPQLWNVLRGDMNLVGPRPSPDDENQFCPAWREARLSVKPGLTGLWQIRRTRAPMSDFQEWIRWDLEYVQRRSWRLDLWIIWRTARSLVTGRGSEPTPMADGTEALATFTGFHPPAARAAGRPEDGAAAASITPGAARGQGQGRDRMAGFARLGFWTPARDATRNADAVQRAAADERARTIARTSIGPGAGATEPAADADANATPDRGDEQQIRHGRTGTDAGTVDASRRRTGDATVRGTDAPAPGPALHATPEPAADDAVAPRAPGNRELEAKPRQPVLDPDAIARRDVEAKPGAPGLPPSIPADGDAAATDDGGDHPDAPPGGGRRAA